MTVNLSPSDHLAAGVMISDLADMKTWVKAYVTGATNSAATQKERLACLPTGGYELSFGLGIGCSNGHGHTRRNPWLQYWRVPFSPPGRHHHRLRKFPAGKTASRRTTPSSATSPKSPCIPTTSPSPQTPTPNRRPRQNKRRPPHALVRSSHALRINGSIEHREVRNTRTKNVSCRFFITSSNG